MRSQILIAQKILLCVSQKKENYEKFMIVSASDDHRPEQLVAMHVTVTNIDRSKMHKPEYLFFSVLSIFPVQWCAGIATEDFF